MYCIIPFTVCPRIVEHPVRSQTIYPGVMVNFSCRAEGYSTLSYSWYIVTHCNVGVRIENASNPIYSISNTTYKHRDQYYCVATNNEGIAVSHYSYLGGN